jgi:mRNA interferase RelE/StbE
MYTIELTELAESDLNGITDERIRQAIRERIDRLAQEPEKQGKPLGRELRGMYSVRAVGQRYRVIYRIDSGVLVVLVVGVGIRREGAQKDAYSKISKRKDA